MSTREKEPAPFGIPNRIGNTCWFQSATQCIFRTPEMRKRILSFNPATVQIKHDPETLHLFDLLIEHFNDLMACNPEISNVELVKSLKLRDGRNLIAQGQSSGQDSYLAVDAYFCLCSLMVGGLQPGLHSFASPMGDILSLRHLQVRTGNKASIMPAYIFILDDAINNQTAMLKHLPDMFFLPKVLIMRRDRKSEDMTHPDPYITLPEPLDFVAAECNLSKCKTSVKYELYATVCYQGSNIDHALALLKIVGTNKWYELNDFSVTERGDDSCLKDKGLLSSQFNWPALFFYRKIE